METAKDYLISFTEEKTCDVWVKKVIKSFLQMEPEKRIKDLAEDLLGIKEYMPKIEPVVTISDNKDDVMVEELVHNTGVNALAEKQKIRFSPQVNIIYGLNGTGKSSYFRILSGMTGRKKNCSIRPNVYIDEIKPVSVEMTYRYRGVEKKVTWDGSEEGVPDLASIRVFNSDYTKELLKKRDSDELVVKPYGLQVFADLLSYIDEIVTQADELIDNCWEKRPSIDTSAFLDDFKHAFNGEMVSAELRGDLDGIFASTEDFEARIEEKESLVSDLRVGNPRDKITIIRGKIKEARKVGERIKEIVTKREELIGVVSEGIKNYNELFKRSEEHKKEIEVLNRIPGNESNSWKEFISHGIKYSNEYIEGDECPFCHQTLSDHAKSIVEAYVLFLNNNDQVEFAQADGFLKKKYSEIEKWNLFIDLDEEKLGKDLLKEINYVLSTFHVTKSHLLSAIKSKEYKPIEEIDYSGVSLHLQEYIKDLELRAEMFGKQSDEISKSLDVVENELLKMKSNYSVKLQQRSIEEYLRILSWVHEKRSVVNATSSYRKRISNISKKAHNDLLTVQLRDKFNKTLKELGVKNIEIDLQGTNNNGVQHTEFTIRKNKDISSILSEGEQKATALALFLSEIVISKNKSTIVFDDPVNSLDHKMMQNLADLLTRLDNQIIVFTHSKLFFDSFACSENGHICKGLDIVCKKNKGKHIWVYETKSEGKNRKGVIIERKIENLEYYLDSLGKLLNESPFTKFDEAAIELRRGVEAAVDEIVLNNLIPTKMSSKSDPIRWGELKKVCNDTSLIDGLHKIHGRVSGGEIHSGTEREENPLDKEEIEEMYKDLSTLRDRYKK